MPPKKRQLTKKQLAALKRGRAIRKKNLLKAGKKGKKRKRKMTKRRRGATLTGGSMDVNPQLMSGSLTILAADVNTVQYVKIPNPVAHGIFSKAGRATVMEVLKIWVDQPNIGGWQAVSAFAQTLTAFFTNVPGTSLDLGQAGSFAAFHKSTEGAFTAAGTYAKQETPIQMVDLTDGQGHGVLVGTDYIYFANQTSNFAAADVVFYFKLLYRFKNVALAEYIGIVQSQT